MQVALSSYFVAFKKNSNKNNHQVLCLAYGPELQPAFLLLLLMSVKCCSDCTCDACLPKSFNIRLKFIQFSHTMQDPMKPVCYRCCSQIRATKKPFADLFRGCSNFLLTERLLLGESENEKGHAIELPSWSTPPLSDLFSFSLDLWIDIEVKVPS